MANRLPPDQDLFFDSRLGRDQAGVTQDLNDFTVQVVEGKGQKKTAAARIGEVEPILYTQCPGDASAFFRRQLRRRSGFSDREFIMI